MTAESGTGAAAKTILVVDDEPDVRNYLRMILEDAGFKVVTAGDGEEALAMVRRTPPDFISLDLVMPRRSGHKFLFEMRRDPNLARIPVLIVTAHAQDEMGRGDLQDLLDNRMLSGPGTYLEKPVNPGNYVRSIQRALGLPEAAASGPDPELRRELERSLETADPDDLRRALGALRRRKTQ